MGDEMAADFALAAVREDGLWSVVPLPPAVADDPEHLIKVLRQQAGDIGAIGLLSFAEDFFVIVRVVGDHARILLSDVTAAFDSVFASHLLEKLDLPMPDGDDEDDVEPAGDLDLLADLGASAMLMADLCDDLDLYPDDAFARIAEHIGFADQYDVAVNAVA